MTTRNEQLKASIEAMRKLTALVETLAKKKVDEAVKELDILTKSINDELARRGKK